MKRKSDVNIAQCYVLEMHPGVFLSRELTNLHEREIRLVCMPGRIHCKQRFYCVLGLGNSVKRTMRSFVKYPRSVLYISHLRFTMMIVLE